VSSKKFADFLSISLFFSAGGGSTYGGSNSFGEEPNFGFEVNLKMSRLISGFETGGAKLFFSSIETLLTSLVTSFVNGKR
jgi:hypothetical protein